MLTVRDGMTLDPASGTSDKLKLQLGPRALNEPSYDTAHVDCAQLIHCGRARSCRRSELDRSRRASKTLFVCPEIRDW